MAKIFYNWHARLKRRDMIPDEPINTVFHQVTVKSTEMPSVLVPILNGLKIWLDTALTHVTPSSLTGNALAYLHKQWPTLTVYCEDGRLDIDNNGVERAIRPFVIGRNNWIFSGAIHAAQRPAPTYTA